MVKSCAGSPLPQLRCRLHIGRSESCEQSFVATGLSCILQCSWLVLVCHASEMGSNGDPKKTESKGCRGARDFLISNCRSLHLQISQFSCPDFAVCISRFRRSFFHFWQFTFPIVVFCVSSNFYPPNALPPHIFHPLPSICMYSCGS